MLSVALSLTSRPVGVTHHHVPRSPDFPLAETGCWADMAARRASTSDHPVYSKPKIKDTLSRPLVKGFGESFLGRLLSLIR